MFKRVILVSATIFLTFAFSPTTQASEKPRNIILFGWDGAQRDHVKESLSRKELPNLQKLIDEGIFVEIDIEGKTDTKAGWTQILTGYYPEVTGVYSNKQYKLIPQGLSLFERLEEHFGPDTFVTVAVIGKAGNVGAAAPKKIKSPDDNPNLQTNKTKAGKNKPVGTYWRENGIRYQMIPGQPFHFTKDSMDLFENGLKENEKVGARAIELLEKHKDRPFFFFVHFADIDKAGHKQGENSKEYNDALISSDLWTGRIMTKIHQLGLAEKTEFYITSDHGFNEDKKGHSFAPYVFLATNNKKVNRKGLRQDVAPTIMEAFGLNLSQYKPAIDGISLTQPDNRLPAKITRETRKPDILYVRKLIR